MKIRIAYGAVLTQTRTERGLTLRETAGLAHISPSYLHEVEKGKKDASSELLGALLTALDVPPIEFFANVSDLYRKGQDASRSRLNRDEPVCA